MEGNVSSSNVNVTREGNILLFGVHTGSPSSTQWWSGIIDEVGIWNRILTSSEVSELYNNGGGLAFGDSGAGPSLQNATFFNVNVTNNLTVGSNVSAIRGFFDYLGSSISRIIKGWFTDIDVSGTSNLTGQTYIKNASCSAGQVLTTDSSGLVSCTNKANVKSGTISVTEGTPITITFATAFSNTPDCTVSVDLSGSGSAVKGMAFFTNTPNTTAIRIDWDDAAGGAGKTENLMWVCTDAGNS